jgi:hypothetical protein
MLPPRRASLQGWLIALSLYACSIAVHADDWLPISAEELKMTGVPQAPAAAAIYLYRQVDRDDNGPTEMNYERIKILTEEGREFANVEIPYYEHTESIRGIQARTIHPDGSVVKFDGTIFDKPLVARTGLKLLAKTFTLPDVQVGSIIEYRYRHDLRPGYVFDSHWILSQNLFTQYAKFSLNPYRGFDLRFSWPQGLPDNTEAPKDRSGRIRLETRDVPAFVTEEYMPPEGTLKYRVDFIYEADATRIEKEPEVFWQKYAKRKYGTVERFIDQRRAMMDAVARIVEPTDTQEMKLRKIYARTQQIRNLSYERARSSQESDRENLKDAKDVGDVWNLGYGDGEQITWLFLALARAAGVEAYPVLVSTRDTHFFNARLMNAEDLNTNVVLAIIDGKEWYLDPGTQYAPFGMLPWAETSAMGLRLEKNGGTWIHTNLPDPHESRIERKATLRLTASGALEGKIAVTYTGLEALGRRLEERHEDETDRKEYLESQLKDEVPSGAVVELTNQPDWDSSAPLLIAEFDISIPGWATRAGKRTLLPVGIFGAQYKHAFQHAARTHPIYFRFPYQEADEVVIELEPAWTMSNVPQSRKVDLGSFRFAMSSEDKNNSLHVNREFTLNGSLVPIKYYPSVQSFFETVRAGDADQAIVVPAKASAAH